MDCRLGYLVAAVLGAVVAGNGCGRSTRATVPVRGKITFGGGACPAPGAITFGPVRTTDKDVLRPAFATFGADGEFQVTSFRPGDGLVPGTYRVGIECWKVAPSDVAAGVSYLPEGFRGPEITVPTDGPVLIDIPIGGARRN